MRNQKESRYGRRPAPPAAHTDTDAYPGADADAYPGSEPGVMSFHALLAGLSGHPEYLYYALLAGVVFPVALIARSRLALLILAVWAIGQSAYLVGMPEPQTQAAIYAIALVIGMRNARNSASMFAAVMFLPLIFVSIGDWQGWMNPVEAWWSIYWIALTQAMSLPFNPLVLAAFKRVWGRNKEGDGMGMLRTVYA